MNLPESVTVRRAGPDDADALKPLIEGGYRGGSARRGWTHEADIIEDENICEEAVLFAPTPMLPIVFVWLWPTNDAYVEIYCIAWHRQDPLRGYFASVRSMTKAPPLPVWAA